MNRTWVVVADSSRARIFDVPQARGPLREIESLDHPESRLHATELTDDRPQRVHAFSGSAHHGLTQPVDHKTAHAVRFARTLAAHLDARRRGGRFSRLILAAAPRFLGHLRDELAPGTAAVVTREYDKDWVPQDAARIRELLPTYL